MLEAEFKLRALIVTEDQDEEARIEAAAIARKNRYDAVVSVAMLREGWDVPEVAVILPLRKMGSKVYGPQIIGRGLRRVRRPDIGSDEGQICAIVDHPKLEHDWLWELLKARVRQDVGVQQEFDETGELPPPPPKQEIVKSDLLIEIPEPSDNGGGFKPPVVDPPTQPSRNWRTLLTELDLPREFVEISDQHITGVEATELGQRGWTKHVSGPGDVNLAVLQLSDSELPQAARERLRSISEQVVTEHGYASQEQRHVWVPLKKYFESKLLDGERLSAAAPEALRRALRVLPSLEGQLMRRTDIVGGMIEYADD